MIVGIDHIEFIVRDVKAHVEFYQKLGFKLLRWTDHHEGSAELQLPGENQPIIEIHQLMTEENPGNYPFDKPTLHVGYSPSIRRRPHVYRQQPDLQRQRESPRVA